MKVTLLFLNLAKIHIFIPESAYGYGGVPQFRNYSKKKKCFLLLPYCTIEKVTFPTTQVLFETRTLIPDNIGRDLQDCVSRSLTKQAPHLGEKYKRCLFPLRKIPLKSRYFRFENSIFCFFSCIFSPFWSIIWPFWPIFNLI